MFENITARSLSSVTDTFSSQSHSKDFIFARSDYMRSRLMMLSLPANYNQSLIGYSFIPYLLVVTLSILPFTLIESFTLGLGLLVLQFFSSWIISPGFTPEN